MEVTSCKGNASDRLLGPTPDATPPVEVTSCLGVGVGPNHSGISPTVGRSRLTRQVAVPAAVVAALRLRVRAVVMLVVRDHTGLPSRCRY